MIKVKNVAKYSLMISLILVLSKLIGTVREIVIASQYGATDIADIFKVSTNIPNIFYLVIASALSVSFIPVFADIKNDKEKANRFFNNILNIIIIICIICTLIGIVFSMPIVQKMAGGKSPEILMEMSNYTKIVMPTVIFLAISGLYTGYLQSYGIFLQPALTGIVSSLVIIIAVVIFSDYGVGVAVIAFFLSAVAQVVMQRPFMKGYKYKFVLDFKDEHVRKMIRLAIPILIATAASQINVFVATNYASRFAEGSIAIVDYATKISTLINQAFIVSITTVFYPIMTERFADNKLDDFKDTFKKATNIISIVVLPMAVGLFILADPVIALVFQSDKFDAYAVSRTSSYLKVLVFSTIGFSFIDIFSKAFYAMKNTFIPMINGLLQMILNVIFIVVLTPIFKYNGLGIATTLTVIIVGGVTLIQLKYKIKDLPVKEIVTTNIKGVISSIIMGIGVYYTYILIGNRFASITRITSFIKIIIPAIVGVIIYAIMLKVLKVKEFEDVINSRSLK
ncbi:murein biosynthesis integral membrane protein MurJ [Clostridium gasigenes]|nr:murein biosynthesis integral membrane protein MurJ [Clostridium gasigenes]